jgi:UDP-3-O-[3-hydroxymyristoyl] glucosamine N-acyltransferase
MEFNAEQIAAYLQGQVEGDPKAVVTTFAKIEEGVPGAITFLSDIHYEHYLYDTKASVVLVNKDFKPSKSVTATLIRVEDARACVARLLTLYQQAMSQPRVGIHSQACVAETAQIGKNVYVGPHAYVGENVVIGDGSQLYAGVVVEERATVGENCILYPNVSVYHDCHVGNRVILHSGCCIGSDGFGFAPVDGGYEKIPQIGNAIIEDDVEIGANSCVDRAVMGSTYVRKGVKLDNLVQIAHNCDIGENTVMSAQVGVAGSTKIGQWCMFGGQVGIAGHIEIADRTRSGAQAGIAGKVRKSDQVIIGSPAMDARQFARCSAVFKNLPELWKDVNDLKRAFENK